MRERDRGEREIDWAQKSSLSYLRKMVWSVNFDGLFPAVDESRMKQERSVGIALFCGSDEEKEEI